MKRGKFIAFEGGEGSGKDTMIDLLKEKYADRTDIVFTREPGGTPIGEKIRGLLMASENAAMEVRTELLLFVAARAQLVAEVIAPALAQNKTVISNRFGLSTIAYQIYRKQKENYLPFLQQVSTFAVGEYVPTLYVLLDVTPEVGLRRVAARKGEVTRFDQESLEVHRRIRQGYMAHIGDYSHVVIDADDSMERVWENVQRSVEPLVTFGEQPPR